MKKSLILSLILCQSAFALSSHEVAQMMNYPYYSTVLETSSLNNRLDALKSSPQLAGTWLNTTLAKSKGDGFKGDYYSIVAGYDVRNSMYFGDIVAGITVSSDYFEAKSIKLKNHNYTMGAYASMLSQEGLVLDASLRFKHQKADFYDLGDDKANSLLLNAKIGYKAGIDSFFYPSFELFASRLSGFSLANSNFVAQLDSRLMLSGKAMITVGNTLPNQVQISASIGSYFDITKGAKTYVTTQSESFSARIGRDSKAFFAINANFEPSQNTGIYAGIEKTFAGDFDTQIALNLKVKYMF